MTPRVRASSVARRGLALASLWLGVPGCVQAAARPPTSPASLASRTATVVTVERAELAAAPQSEAVVRRSVAAEPPRAGQVSAGEAPGPWGEPPSFPQRYARPLAAARAPALPLVTGDASVDAELAAGDAATGAGDLAGARRHFEAARTRAPGRAAPLVGLARVRVARVDAPLDVGAARGNAEIAAAASDLRHAARSEPALAAAHVDLGRALLLLGDTDGALAALARGASLAPAEPEALSMAGIALLASGRGDAAIAALARAARLDPGSAARHGNLGTALLMRGRVVDAVTELEVAVEITPADSRAHADLGAALLARGDASSAERATRELERAVASDPQRAIYRTNLGQALLVQGRAADAIARHREALKIDDRLVSAWVNLGVALAREPHARASARAAFERARTLDPADPRPRANLEELDAIERASVGISTPSSPR